MTNRLALRILALAVALFACAVLVWRATRPSRESAQFIARQNRLNEAIGYVLGQELAQRFPNGGDVLVLLNGLPSKKPSTGADAACLRGLQAGFGSVKLQARLVTSSPRTESEKMAIQSEWSQTGVPAARLKDWFDGHASAVGLVAFAPVQVGPGIPPLFLSSAPLVATENWLEMVKPGKLEAVVLTSPSFSWDRVSVQDSLPKLFQQCCELINPANVEAARSRLLNGR